MRECQHCKTSIEHRNYQAKYCSDRCKGLHIPINLRIITRLENRKKRNDFFI